MAATEQAVTVETGDASLAGDLAVPGGAGGVVVFAHGSGSSRLSPRNRLVAERLRAAGLGTLLFDLLTEEEEAVDARTRHLRFDIEMLAGRLTGAVEWVRARLGRASAVGAFGASTGGGAALVAAARRPDLVGAVVSRGGRPDLAGDELPRVRAPTLLLVGGEDHVVIDLNRQALERLGGEARLELVPGATHLFEEPGALELVAEQAADWFATHL